jgi:uncharacterized protein (TIGR02145 family)
MRIMQHPIRLLLSFLFLVFLFCSCQEEMTEVTPSLKIKGSIVHVSDFGGNDGAVYLSILGGSQPYSYLWSNDATTQNIEGLSAGSYYVLVTDSKNQTKRDSFLVTQPAPVSMVITFKVKEPSQTGAVDGNILTDVAGGYPPFTYKWSDGQTTKDREGIGAGLYIVTVTDAKSQAVCDSVEVTDCLKDIDGNTYGIVRIGDQLWMKENLRVLHAPDSTAIQGFAYNNDTSFIKTFGLLYTWNTAMDGSEKEGAQGICPKGWHIPSDEEFKVLEIFLGMTRAEADMVNTWRGVNVGTQLKAGGKSGYNAKLAGRRSTEGYYSLMGRAEYVWTSSSFGTNAAWRRCLDLYSNDVGRWNTFPQSYGFSVRCIKDD